MVKNKCVLVIDDEREIAQVACIRLQGAGYRTLTAIDGQMGVDMATTEKPNAIVLDMRMPRMDGLAALHELRSRKDTQHIPIVMLSASLIDKHRALDAGARFFVTKPYDANTFIAAVDKAIEEQPFPVSHDFCLGIACMGG